MTSYISTCKARVKKISKKFPRPQLFLLAHCQIQSRATRKIGGGGEPDLQTRLPLDHSSSARERELAEIVKCVSIPILHLGERSLAPAGGKSVSSAQEHFRWKRSLHQLKFGRSPPSMFRFQLGQNVEIFARSSPRKFAARTLSQLISFSSRSCAQSLHPASLHRQRSRRVLPTGAQSDVLERSASLVPSLLRCPWIGVSYGVSQSKRAMHSQLAPNL